MTSKPVDLEEAVSELFKQVLYIRFLLMDRFESMCKDSLLSDPSGNSLDTNYYMKNLSLLQEQTTHVIPKKLEEYRVGGYPVPSVHTDMTFHAWLEKEMKKPHE